MNTIVIALLSACVIGASLAQEDCSSQVKAFHQCLQAQHNQTRAANKQKWEAKKPQVDACYTSNGCPVPAKKAGKDGASNSKGKGDDAASNNARKQCREAVHKQAQQQILACVKQANPAFNPPAHDGKKGEGHHGGPHHKWGGKKHGDMSAFATCPDKQKQAAVFQCLRKLRNSSAPNDAQKEQEFNARCQAKKTCQAKLSAQCQQQMKNVRKSFCQCAQQQFQPAQQEKLRSGTPACQGVQQQAPKAGQAQGRGQRKAKSCDEEKPDYCQLGYQQFKADQEKHKAEYQQSHQQSNGQQGQQLLPLSANLNVHTNV